MTELSVQLPERYSADLVKIGEGAFGVVYRTRDLVRDVPVAVKVPFGRGAGPRAREVVLELRAAASLRHPGFVRVLDAGQDPEGVPFLVMDLADAGSLQSVLLRGGRPWPQVAPWVAQMTDALAYAHARGLVHRDIKPDNVLLKREGDAVQTKIADFGLAKIQMRQGDYRSTRLMAGTILYMPPEAFENDSSMVHPGVDLYALGVMIFQLLTGRLPWKSTQMGVILAKAQGRHERLEPDGERIPANVAEVVERLLQPDPTVRPQLAADVRDALFGPRTGLGAESPPPALPAGPPATPALAVVREPPLLGREAEKQRLWDAARGAVGRPVRLILSGRSGIGRSRLVTWLASQLEEAGSARTLHVQLGPGSTPADALGWALRRFLLIGATQGDELELRIRRWFAGRGHEEESDVAALAKWLDPSSAPSTLLAASEAAASRVALVDRVLRLESRRGLVVLRIEDEAGDGAGLAAALAKRAEVAEHPLLVVYDSEDAEPVGPLAGWEAISLGPLEDGAVEGILRDLAVPEDAVSDLARRADGLPARAVEAARLLSSAGSAALAQAARARSVSQSEIFAAARGDTEPIRPTDAALARVLGFIRAGADQEPDELVVRGRLIATLGLLPRPCPEPLLGSAMVRADPTWTFAEVEVGLEAAVFAGVVVRDPDGRVRLAGGAMATAAREYAQDRGDLGDLARDCAAALRDAPGARPGDVHAAGRMLRDAGLFEEAFDVLIEAAQALALSDAESSSKAWREALAAGDKAGVPQSDPRWTELALGAAAASRELGNLDAAFAMLERVDPDLLDDDSLRRLHEVRASVRLLALDLEPAQADAVAAIEGHEAADDRPGVARALLLLAEIIARSGRREDAIGAFERAQQEAEEAGAVREAVWAKWRRGVSLRTVGRTREAQAQLEGALAEARELGLVGVQGGVLRELGNIAIMHGRPDDAETHLRRSVQCLDSAGRPGEAAVTRISLGELARARGDLVGARSEYSGAFAITRAYGLKSEVVVALLNLGIVEIAMGRERSAARRLAEIDRILPPEAPHALRPYLDALRLACRAERGRWEDAEEALEALLDAESIPADPDVVALIEHGAVAAGEGGEPSLATDAMDLALRLAEDMKDVAAAKRIRDRMATSFGG